MKTLMFVWENGYKSFQTGCACATSIVAATVHSYGLFKKPEPMSALSPAFFVGLFIFFISFCHKNTKLLNEINQSINLIRKIKKEKDEENVDLSKIYFELTQIKTHVENESGKYHCWGIMQSWKNSSAIFTYLSILVGIAIAFDWQPESIALVINMPTLLLGVLHCTISARLREENVWPSNLKFEVDASLNKLRYTVNNERFWLWDKEELVQFIDQNNKEKLDKAMETCKQFY